VATATTADGTRLYWEESGEGEPLLLIQGLGFSGAMWYRILPALEARHRVIRYDARGIGRSEIPDGPYSIPLMAADAIAVLDAAGVDTAHVFGCSLGGIVAQEVAISHADRVRSLTLCCTHPAGTDAVWPDDEVMDMLRNRNTLPREEAIRASIPVGYAPTTPADHIEEDVRLRLEIPTHETGYMGQLMAGLGYPGTKARLPEVTVPALVIHGDGDRMVPVANAQILADALPDARAVIVQGAGHVIFTDAPDAVTDAMLEFLDGVSADAPRG
jgi:pimeloyl-ACP methyl ester carboxylesterase